MDSKLFLIDGHALVFKMYYAFARRPMVNSKGADMSILFGFTKYLLELIDREKPTHVAVAFDPPGGTFRNEMYPEYKANRAETPQLVIDSLEPLIGICKALGLCVLMKPGFEADDVIGTVAKKFGGPELDVYMVTPDKDYGQLVGDHVFQLKPGKAGEPDQVLDSAAICERYGIGSPSQVIEMLTICGDSADNIPGVRGVGEVGASKLISLYGSVREIYSNLDKLTPRQRQMFTEAASHLDLSHELVTIKTDVPLEETLQDMLLPSEYGNAAADLFSKYEFQTLMRYLGNVRGSGKGRTLEYRTVSPDELCREAYAQGLVAVAYDGDGTGIFGEISLISLAVKVKDGVLVSSGGVDEFSALLEDGKVRKCGYALKRLISRLRYAGLTLGGGLDDLELMHYLIDPERGHRLELLVSAYLDADLPREEEGEESSLPSLFDGGSSSSPPRYAEAAAYALLDAPLRTGMDEAAVTTLYEQIEEPLIRVLADMEYDGVKIDLGHLRSYATSLEKELSGRENEIREMAGDPKLNISSPRQVGVLLFEKLNLNPKAKKGSKGDWTTDEAALSEIADKHPIVGKILEYREVKKLLSTYIKPFPQYVLPLTGKIHTTFNQALTATGRLSSSNPNLQNIPVRSDRGKEIRKAFVPSDPAGSILSADYSQIELRVMAHLCGDTHMLEAFRSGVDVHRVTASRIFGLPYDEVSPEQRRTAKTANFGIMYGISSFGLAQRLGVSRAEAKGIIDDYFAAFPMVKAFIDTMISSAREKGYAETLFGRRRYLPDIASKNVTVRGLAERNAVNAPIQGTAADMIKIAMVGVSRRLEAEGFRSRMVLQIHDELLFDVVPGEEERLKAMVVDEMEHVISLSVPLTAECGYGKNWLEAH